MCDLLILLIFQYHSGPKYRWSLIIYTSNLNNCLDQCNFLHTTKNIMQRNLAAMFLSLVDPQPGDLVVGVGRAVILFWNLTHCYQSWQTSNYINYCIITSQPPKSFCLDFSSYRISAFWLGLVQPEVCLRRHNYKRNIICQQRYFILIIITKARQLWVITGRGQ